MDDVDAEVQESFAHELRGFSRMGPVDFLDRRKKVGIVLVTVRERLNPPVGDFKRVGVVDIDDKLAAAEARILPGKVFEEGEFIHMVCVVFEGFCKKRSSPTAWRVFPPPKNNLTPKRKTEPFRHTQQFESSSLAGGRGARGEGEGND